MPLCARCQKSVDFVQRDYLYEHKEICPNCSHILQRIQISHKPIDQLPCHDCGNLTFLDEGEYEKTSEEDHSTTFRCDTCSWKVQRNKMIENGESKILMVSDSPQYSMFEEIECRRWWAFQGNGNNFNSDDPNETDNHEQPLQLYFTYSETGKEEDREQCILQCLSLHNHNEKCQDFYEVDWMMFLDDETDQIDLFFGLHYWLESEQHQGHQSKPCDKSVYLKYDDPFIAELLKLAREKWPVYDADYGRMPETVKLLQEQKIGTVIGTEWIEKRNNNLSKDLEIEDLTEDGEIPYPNLEDEDLDD